MEAGKVALKAAGIASTSAGGGDRSFDFCFCLRLLGETEDGKDALKAAGIASPSVEGGGDHRPFPEE